MPTKFCFVTEKKGRKPPTEGKSIAEKRAPVKKLLTEPLLLQSMSNECEDDTSSLTCEHKPE